MTVSKALVVFKVYPVLMARLELKVYQEKLAPKEKRVLPVNKVSKVFRVLLVLELTFAVR